MTQPTKKLGPDWSLVTSASTFTLQNISKTPVELRFAASVPATDEKGFILGYLMGLTDSDGSGNLYGRGPRGVVTVSES